MNERRKAIYTYILNNDEAKIDKLSEMLEVSDMTIRRDLRYLRDQHLITLVKGGAIIKSSMEFSYEEREIMDKVKKSEIAHEAIKFINPGDSIILDGSSTSYFLSKLLPSGVRVVTNSIPIASSLMLREDVEVILLGGSMVHSTGTLVGPKTENMLEAINVDKVFLSSNALDMTFGLSDKTIQESTIKKEMLRSATENIIMMESNNINKKSFCKVCDIDRIDNLIVDSQSTELDYKNLRSICTKNKINLLTS